MKMEEAENIDRYLRDEMSTSERLAFESKVSQDAALQRELDLHRDLMAGMEYHYNASLKRKLQAREEASTPTHTPVAKPASRGRRFFLVSMGIAATFLILFIGGYFYLSSTTAPTEFYYAYYQPYPNIINPVERSGVMPEDTLARALIAYERGDFQQAIQMFQEAKNELSPGHQFYLALSHLESGNQLSAIEHLQEVIIAQDDTFYLPALWYQGLAHLAAQQPEEAKEVLGKLLEEEDSTYYAKAQKILSEL